MKRLIVMPFIALVLLPALPAPVWAQPAPVAEQSELLAITSAMTIATGRFAGQIIAAELQPGRPEEMTDIVYAFRLLTERGDVLAIRVDAVTGDILDVDGRGLVDARRRGSQ